MITMTTGKVQVTLQSPDLHFTHTHGAASGRTKVELDTRLIRWSSLLRRCPALMMTIRRLLGTCIYKSAPHGMPLERGKRFRGSSAGGHGGHRHHRDPRSCRGQRGSPVTIGSEWGDGGLQRCAT